MPHTFAARPIPRLTLDEIESLSLTRIGVELRQQEPELYTKKWFDYRWSHPCMSTLHFAQQYERAVKNAYAVTRDRDASEALVVLPDMNVMVGRDCASFWAARQALDTIGCRYDWALRWVMTRCCDRGWHVLPRPNQLYSHELVLDIADAWKIECAASLQFARSPLFQASRFNGHPHQIAYREFMVEQIKRRGVDSWRSLSRVLGMGALDTNTAINVFGLKDTKRACDIAGIVLVHS